MKSVVSEPSNQGKHIPRQVCFIANDWQTGMLPAGLPDNLQTPFDAVEAELEIPLDEGKIQRKKQGF